jgi:ubiquinone biosynthesis protein
MIRSGSICLSLLYNYLTSESLEDDEFENKHTALSTISKTFSNYGGILSKISQIIAYGEGNSSSSIFSDCKPFNSENTSLFFDNEMKNNILFNDVLSYEKNVYKSGSIGQVHKGIMKINDINTNVAFKVQYTKLKEQCEDDIKILDGIIHFLYTGNNFSHAVNDIKRKINDELNYKQEIYNMDIFFNLWKDNSNILIPKVFSSKSTDKIICMEFIHGISLNDFINNSTDHERNKYGMLIAEFVFTSLFRDKLFYSDIHYGNFLIKGDKLCVMDFGCINVIDDVLSKQLKRLYYSIYYDNEEDFYSLLFEMQILNDKVSTKSRDYAWTYFKQQLAPWIINDFTFTKEWLTNTTHKDFTLLNEWNLPQNIVYLNKINFGLIHILQKMQVSGNFTQIFKKLSII